MCFKKNLNAPGLRKIRTHLDLLSIPKLLRTGRDSYKKVQDMTGLSSTTPSPSSLHEFDSETFYRVPVLFPCQALLEQCYNSNNYSSTSEENIRYCLYQLHQRSHQHDIVYVHAPHYITLLAPPSQKWTTSDGAKRPWGIFQLCAALLWNI